MTESASRYSFVSILLHWTIAALVAANVFIGGQMTEAEGAAHQAWLGAHKSVGVSVLLLTLVRLAWRLAHPWPALPAQMAKWERALARAAHAGFYVLLLGVPLLGWAAVSAQPASPEPLFGAIPWPDMPVPSGEGAAEALGGAHKLLVKTLYGVIALHVLGALKHYVFDRDEVLTRMLPIMPRRG